jgi:hypothetical protein
MACSNARVHVGQKLAMRSMKLVNEIFSCLRTDGSHSPRVMVVRTSDRQINDLTAQKRMVAMILFRAVALKNR